MRREGFSGEDIRDIDASTARFVMSNRLIHLTNMRPNETLSAPGR